MNMFKRLFFWCNKLFTKPEIKVEHVQPHNKIRKNMDINSIRSRINQQGWQILEIPIKKNSPDPSLRIIARWKIVASKGSKTCEVGGLTIEEALKNLGVTLGVISKNEMLQKIKP